MRLFLLLSFALTLGVAVHSADYYVSPRGGDTAPGMLEQPWRKIQKAADTLQPGDTVHVRRGTHRELVNVRVSGTAGSPITFSAFAGGRVIPDATRILTPEEDRALIYIEDRSHLVIRGFDLRNLTTRKPDAQPAGIFVRSACREIELRGNRI